MLGCPFVEVRGFETPTSTSPTWSSADLIHTPNAKANLEFMYILRNTYFLSRGIRSAMPVPNSRGNFRREIFREDSFRKDASELSYFTLQSQ